MLHWPVSWTSSVYISQLPGGLSFPTSLKEVKNKQIKIIYSNC